jgi:hypothetical protein
MRISEWGWRDLSSLALVAIAAAGVVVAAFSIDDRGAQSQQYTSVKEAYGTGSKALSEGHIDEALPALEFAAQRGALGAQLRLGRIYGSLDSVHRNDAKALHYFHLVAKDHADIDRLHPAARHVSEAFRRLAHYYRSGVPAAGVQPDAHKAAQLLRHAASYFRDAQAQFAIGRMYAEGDGVTRNKRLAVRWLLKASQKRYAPAQAYLGEMLWAADAGEAMRARGLAFLALAVGNAGSADRSGIEHRYQNAGKRASTTEIQQAGRFIAAWDNMRASDAAVDVTRLLSQTPYAAPAGSTVVADSEVPSLQELLDALSQRPATSLLWGRSAGLPEDSANYSGDSAPVADDDPLPMVRRFVLNKQARTKERSPADPFASMEAAQFSGETLSISVEVAPEQSPEPEERKSARADSR